MRNYLLSFSLLFASLFFGLWLITSKYSMYFMDADLAIFKAHLKYIKDCDTGDLAIVGDSASIADYLPNEIGPNVRTLSISGSTPVDAYYIVEKMLACQHKPKAVLLSFTPFKYSYEGDGNVFWKRGVDFNLFSYQDLIDVLKISREQHNNFYFGEKSLFDLDAYIKSYLYANKFPPYFMGSLLGYLKDAKKTGNFLWRREFNQRIYADTRTNYGHHLYGNLPALNPNDTKDFESTKLTKLEINPFNDFYLRKTIRLLAKNNITSYLNSCPRNGAAAQHYPENLLGQYKAYLHKVAAEEKIVTVVTPEIEILPINYFGDPTHLNLLGAKHNSEQLRIFLQSTPQSSLVFKDQQLLPHNLYEESRFNLDHWQQVKINLNYLYQPTDKLAPPTLKFAGAGKATQFDIIAGNEDGEGRLNPPPLPKPLKRNTDYVTSILVKNNHANKVEWRLLFLGHFDGKVTWDFNTHSLSYQGNADPSNSGAELCDNGWVRLWVRGGTGSAKSQYEAPVISLGNANNQSVYLYNVSLEEQSYPANRCVTN